MPLPLGSTTNVFLKFVHQNWKRKYRNYNWSLIIEKYSIWRYLIVIVNCFPGKFPLYKKIVIFDIFHKWPLTPILQKLHHSGTLRQGFTKSSREVFRSIQFSIFTSLVRVMVFNANFQQYFSYIVAVSFIGGRNYFFFVWKYRVKVTDICPCRREVQKMYF
jgi:hypothetical protein